MDASEAMPGLSNRTMPKATFTLAALAAALLAASAPSARAQQPAWQVCFNPGQDCTALIVDEISGAQATILVQAYSFTSVPILSALKAAHARGVDVEVIVDKTSASRRERYRTILRSTAITEQARRSLI